MVRPTRYYSSRQEKQVAKLVNGRVNANSGAAPFVAGDVVANNVLIECKTTTTSTKSYTVKKDVLDKIKKEAYETGRDHAVVAFNFEPDGENYFILNTKFYTELLELYKKQVNS